MTACFVRIPIMRPHHCRTVLHVFILAVLLLTLNADGEDSNCDVAIKVRRNTFYNASLGADFAISCTIEFCKNPPPTVSWYKSEKAFIPIIPSSHIKTEWTSLNYSHGTSFLFFKNILRNDSGHYQCRSGSSVSHVIAVSVYGEPTDVTLKNGTNSTGLDPEAKEHPWMYVHTAAGIVAFVIIVIIVSVASMRGCKGKSKKESRTDDQHMAIPMVEQPFLHTSLQVSPRESPSVSPSRRSTRRKTSPSKPNESPLPRDGERQRNMVEEETDSIVYAALKHQPLAGAAARPRRQKDESSEYAVICVKDH